MRFINPFDGASVRDTLPIVLLTLDDALAGMNWASCTLSVNGVRYPFGNPALSRRGA